MKTQHLTRFLLPVMLSTGACAPVANHAPATAEIEATGMLAIQTQQSEAIAKLRQWANNGIVTAQCELGLALTTRHETQAEAALWLTRAAQAGDVTAQWTIAEAYYKAQLGLQQDYSLAWKWYMAAAAQKQPKASFMLARMSKYGEGTEKNLAQSIDWLRISSEQGNAQAMFLLSNAYEAGEGIEQNKKLSQYWLELAAAGDYPPAIQSLSMQLEDRNSQSHDPQRARHLIKEASDERLLRWNQYQ